MSDLEILTRLDKKTKIEDVLAEVGTALRNAADSAEDPADRVKQTFPDNYDATDDARAAYDKARHSCNEISTRIRFYLIQGKKATAESVNTEEMKGLLGDFEKVATATIAKKKKPAISTTLVGAVPSLGDIAKVFGSIMKAIEWFKTRKDNQRHAVPKQIIGSRPTRWQQGSIAKPSAHGSAESHRFLSRASAQRHGMRADPQPLIWHSPSQHSRTAGHRGKLPTRSPPSICLAIQARPGETPTFAEPPQKPCFGSALSEASPPQRRPTRRGRTRFGFSPNPHPAFFPGPRSPAARQESSSSSCTCPRFATNVGTAFLVTDLYAR